MDDDITLLGNGVERYGRIEIQITMDGDRKRGKVEREG